MRIATDTLPKAKPHSRQPRAPMDRQASRHSFDPGPVLREEGLPLNRKFISYRGDPSLQEITLTRGKYESSADKKIHLVSEICEQLLTQTDCYALHIDFAGAQVRTETILNPFGYEIHDVDALTLAGYVERHFVLMPFDAKINAIDWIQRRIIEGPVARFRQGGPGFARPRPQPRSWTLGSVDDIGNIVRDLARLRAPGDHYLCSAAISLVQGIVTATFNCDATYVVPLRHFHDFVVGDFESTDTEESQVPDFALVTAEA